MNRSAWAELAATIDELSDRLDPKAKAEELVVRAKQLVKDAGNDPDTRPEDRNRARHESEGILLAAHTWASLATLAEQTGTALPPALGADTDSGY